MPVGTIQNIVVCGTGSQVLYSGRAIQCPDGSNPVMVSAYVIDAAQEANFEASNGPFDYAVATSIWGMAFTFVVGLYLVSKSAGVVLNRIKG